jgi:hypothetical protein
MNVDVLAENRTEYLPHIKQPLRLYRSSPSTVNVNPACFVVASVLWFIRMESLVPFRRLSKTIHGFVP